MMGRNQSQQQQPQQQAQKPGDVESENGHMVLYKLYMGLPAHSAAVLIVFCCCRLPR